MSEHLENHSWLERTLLLSKQRSPFFFGGGVTHFIVYEGDKEGGRGEGKEREREKYNSKIRQDGLFHTQNVSLEEKMNLFLNKLQF